MPVECTFSSGFGAVAAFSGNGRYVNTPDSTAVPNDGPLPAGAYYIVDRESGGRMGWLNDFRADLLAGTHRAAE